MPQIRILNSPIENETDPVLLNGSQISSSCKVAISRRQSLWR